MSRCTDNPATFKYAPLDLTSDSIRLLQIRGLDNHRRPDLTLRHAEIREIDYHAVSYTWGSGLDSGTVVVTGQFLRVQRNIYNFLLRLLGFT